MRIGVDRLGACGLKKQLSNLWITFVESANTVGRVATVGVGFLRERNLKVDFCLRSFCHMPAEIITQFTALHQPAAKVHVIAKSLSTAFGTSSGNAALSSLTSANRLPLSQLYPGGFLWLLPSLVAAPVAPFAMNVRLNRSIWGTVTVAIASGQPVVPILLR